MEPVATRPRVFVTVGLLLAGCSGGVVTEVGAGESSAILNQNEEDRGDPAVFFLETNSNYRCSAFLVAPQLVMTAAHCVKASALGNKPSFDLFTGYTIFSGKSGRHLKVDQPAILMDGYVNDHPERGRDLAFLHLKEAIAADHIKPLPVSRAFLPDNFVGTSVRIVGYGAQSLADDNSANNVGTRRVAVVPVKSASASYYELGLGDRGHRACVGDSGGPVLQRAEGDAEESVVGVISFGDEACTVLSAAARIDRYLDFVDLHVPVPEATEDLATTPADLGQPEAAPTEPAPATQP